MNEYFLFCGDNYYPVGGVKDLFGAFNSQQEAEEAFIKHRKSCGGEGSYKGVDWAHVAVNYIDHPKGLTIVSEFDNYKDKFVNRRPEDGRL